MNSHRNQTNGSDDLGRDEARSLAPHWLVDSLDLLDTTVPQASDWEISSQKTFVRRVKSEVRNQESNRIHNSLPGGLARHFKGELPGSVPGGTTKYFSNFLASVKVRIEQTESPSKVSPLLSKALDRFGNKKRHDLPEDYFSDFLVQVHERIDSEEQVPKWLDRSLKDPQVFGVPDESFFERQRESIDARVFRPIAIMRLVKSNRLKVSAVAASAACLALVYTFLPNFDPTSNETMTLNRLHQIHGIESIETVVEVQDEILGSDYSIQLIREDLEDDQPTTVDLEILEPPAVLNVAAPDEDEIIVQ